jgi:hypothetical protein
MNEYEGVRHVERIGCMRISFIILIEKLENKGAIESINSDGSTV